MDSTQNKYRYFLYSFVFLNIAFILLIKFYSHFYVSLDWFNWKLGVVGGVLLIIFVIQFIQVKGKKKLKRFLAEQEVIFDAHPEQDWAKIMVRSDIQHIIDTVAREGINVPTVDDVVEALELVKPTPVVSVKISTLPCKKSENIKSSGMKMPLLSEVLRTRNSEKNTLAGVYSQIQAVTNLNHESGEYLPEAACTAENVKLAKELKERRLDLEDYFTDFRTITFNDDGARALLTSYILALSLRLRNLGISLKDDESYTKAVHLQTNGDTHDLPYLDENYLNPLYKKV